MKRLLTAVIVLPFLIASILIAWLWWLFVALAAASMVLALWEFYLLAKKLQLKPDPVPGFVAGAALITISLNNQVDQLGLNFLLFLLVIIVLVIVTLIRAMVKGAPFDKMIASTGTTILGVLYVALLGTHLVMIRAGLEPQLAKHVLSFFFLVLMGSDIGAYYVGRAIGKHKLAPSISPGKTWEGAVGGVVAALAMATLAHFWFFHELPLKWTLPLALTMSIMGILGDLVESALKRSASAKDAANILPGHGGLLDRLDSLLFNAPLIYYFVVLYFNV
ncbi:MAG TPA: phosphatidate cytidylyltransferase [Pyrinomonadaceae bacterium]|nr:phosphatidate cytidylyltransferase [Pyrinomonadaceae bacterium]